MIASLIQRSSAVENVAGYEIRDFSKEGGS